MNCVKPKRVASVFAILAIALLSGCGNKGDDSLLGASNGIFAPPGGTGVNGLPGGCAPITQPISFQVSGGYIDSANIVAGRLPYSGQSVGQSYIAGSGGGFSGQFGASNWAYGSITLNTNYGVSGPYGGYQSQYYNQGGGGYAPYQSYPQNAYGGFGQNQNYLNAVGTVVISSNMIQRIFSEMGGYGGGGVYNPNQMGWFQYGAGQSWGGGFNQGFNQPGGYPCVSNVAMNIGRNGNQLYAGQVFLYMNGGINGYVLQF